MKVLGLCLAVLLISAQAGNAVVIGSDYVDDIVAVYYFNSEDDGFVADYGSNEVNGALLEAATLAEEGQYGKCLSLAARDDYFGAYDSEAFIGSLNAFSIVAWVKIPNQDDDFKLTAYASNPGVLESKLIGVAQLTVKSDGSLSAVYADIEDDNGLILETTTRMRNPSRKKSS